MTDTELADRLIERPDAPPEQPKGLGQQPGGSLNPRDPLSKQPHSRTEQPDRLSKTSEWSNWTVLAMIILCFFVIVRFRPFAAQSTGEANTLPELRLRPLTGGGRPVTLADLTGRVVLINFWQAGSSPSGQQLSHLAAIRNEFRGQPAFRLLAVSCPRHAKEDLRELRENTREFLREKKVDLPVYADPGGISRSAVDQVVGLSRYPTTLVVDRWGHVRRAWVGYQPGHEAEIRQLVARLLEEGQ